MTALFIATAPFDHANPKFFSGNYSMVGGAAIHIVRRPAGENTRKKILPALRSTCTATAVKNHENGKMRKFFVGLVQI